MRESRPPARMEREAQAWARLQAQELLRQELWQGPVWVPLASPVQALGPRRRNRPRQ